MSNYQCMNCMCGYDDDISSICPHCGYDKNQVIERTGVLMPGTVLNERYLIGNKITDNINGFTYVAWDNYISAKVKIKEYYPLEYCTRTAMTSDVLVSDFAKTKFEKGREIFLQRGEDFKRVPANIGGLVKTLDSFSANNTSYIVIEYIEGTSVADVISKSKMTWSSFGSIIKPVVSTLANIHKMGLVIQSLNPDNIIVTPDRQVRIADYECFNNDKVIESRSVIKQKDSYLPIELYRTGSAITPASDVYSLGCIIYRTLTGVDVEPSVSRANKDRLQPIGSFTDIDKSVENAILNALDVEVNERTHDCGTLFTELFGSQKVERNKKSNGKKKKTAIVVCSLAVALVCAIVGVFFVLSSKSSNGDVNDYIAETIPSLNGMTLEEAEKTVGDFTKKLQKEYKITVSVKEEGSRIKDSDIENKDKVAFQTPKAGQKISIEDSEIDITVRLYEYSADADKGSDSKIEMPNVVNEATSNAKSILVKSGFDENNIIVSEEYNNEVTAGCVIRQDIPAEEIVPANSDVVIVVSKGPMPTTAKPYISSHKSDKNEITTEKSNTVGILNNDDELFGEN